MASGFPPVILESIGIFSYIYLAIWDKKLSCKKISVYTPADAAAGMALGICFSFFVFTMVLTQDSLTLKCGDSGGRPHSMMHLKQFSFFLQNKKGGKQIHSLAYFLWLLQVTIAELSSWEGDHTICKTYNIYYLVLYKKKILTPDINGLQTCSLHVKLNFWNV